MRRWLYVWLLESDLPWPLQAFWKFLTLGMAGLVVYAGLTEPLHPAASIFAFCLAVLCVMLGLFTKLGDG